MNGTAKETNHTGLIRRAQQGDSQALSQLVAHYRRAGYRVAMGILHSPEDAEEAVQEAWIKALQGIGALRTPESFGSWLYRIVANEALALRRRRLLDTTRLAAFGKETARDLLGGSEGSPVPTSCIIQAAIESLTPKDRIVVLLHHLGGMPLKDVAALLEVPPGTVKSRLHHARNKLKKEIIAMKKQSGRDLVVPNDFREVIHSEIGAMPYESLLEDGLKGWRLPRGSSIAHSAESEPALDEHWRVIDHGVIGSSPSTGGAGIIIGDESWADYEVSMLVTALGGGNIIAHVRLTEAPYCCYDIDMMMGWQAIAVKKIETTPDGQPGLTRLSVVDYPLEHQQEYALRIAVRGQSITTYVDGALVNQVTDASFRYGALALTVWESRTMFRDVRVRHLNRGKEAV